MRGPPPLGEKSSRSGPGGSLRQGSAEPGRPHRTSRAAVPFTRWRPGAERPRGTRVRGETGETPREAVRQEREEPEATSEADSGERSVSRAAQGRTLPATQRGTLGERGAPLLFASAACWVGQTDFSRRASIHAGPRSLRRLSTSTYSCGSRGNAWSGRPAPIAAAACSTVRSMRLRAR